MICEYEDHPEGEHKHICFWIDDVAVTTGPFAKQPTEDRQPSEH